MGRGGVTTVVVAFCWERFFFFVLVRRFRFAGVTTRFVGVAPSSRLTGMLVVACSDGNGFLGSLLVNRCSSKQCMRNRRADAFSTEPTQRSGNQ